MDDHFERVLAQPSADHKRGAADGASARSSKRRRDDESTGNGSGTLSRERMAELLAQGEEVPALDARALKTMAHALDKAIRKNALLRSKHSDDPAKFMESEVQLDEELAKWKPVATQPALYGDLVELEVVASLLGLFGHENLDIRLDVINLLAELTDVDEDPAALAPTTALVTHLVDHAFLPLLVKTLDDLDRDLQDGASKRGKIADEDDAVEDPSDTGVYHALQTVENIVDVLPTAASALGASTSIFSVLVRLVSPKRPFDTNKLYASEILSILVQSGRRNREQFLVKTDDDRLDRLLQALAPYRKKDPQGEEEEELVENLLNTLCSLLFEQDGQDRFRRLEGLELMLRFMKDRKQYVFTGALRVLDHALMNHARNCERFIEVGGLKTVFPMFMGKKVAKKKELRVKEIESVTSLMASLCLLVHNDADHDVHARLHAKFMENDMEKLDRVVDLFAKYYDRVQAAVARENPEEDDEDDDDDTAADERYLRRLDAGLFVLQRIALVAAHLSLFSRKIRAYVVIKFHERNVDIEALVAVLHEQLNTLEAEADTTSSTDNVDDSKKQREIQRVRDLLRAFDDDDEDVEDVNDESKGESDATPETQGSKDTPSTA